MKDLVSLSYYRALLAPLRFGAGIKGKICDAWYYGLPCVTTPIGAEGMFLDTYNNNFDYNTIDLKSQYFKSEESVSQFSSINQELSNYYNYENEPKIEEFDFGGSYLNYNIDDFVENCVKIYNEKTLWEIKSKMGYKIVENRMGFLVNEALFLRKISEALSKLPTTRKKNHIQALTWNETLRSTENLAKYISIKNSTKKN